MALHTSQTVYTHCHSLSLPFILFFTLRLPSSLDLALSFNTHIHTHKYRTTAPHHAETSSKQQNYSVWNGARTSVKERNWWKTEMQSVSEWEIETETEKDSKLVWTIERMKTMLTNTNAPCAVCVCVCLCLCLCCAHPNIRKNHVTRTIIVYTTYYGCTHSQRRRLKKKGKRNTHIMKNTLCSMYRVACLPQT